MTKLEAVREIARCETQSGHVKQVAERALKNGSDAALTHALAEAMEHSGTGHVVDVAKRQLGYK